MAKTIEDGNKYNQESLDWWVTNKPSILKILKGTPVPDDTTSNLAHVMLNLGYATVSLRTGFPYYIPSVLSRELSDRATEIMFIRGLLAAVSTGDRDIAKYVYAQCKNRLIRLESQDSLDRFDTFHCLIASDTFVYRHQGTIDGAIKTNQLGSNQYGYSTTNNLFLRVLQSGPDNIATPLVCSVSGEVIESVATWLPTESKYVLINRYDLHHSKYANNTSFYYNTTDGKMVEKITEPSVYLLKWLYPQYTTQMFIELLSCAIISSGEHKAHHNLPMSAGGINHWIDGSIAGAYKCIPWAWRSETHYKEILLWASTNCPRVDVSKLPTYSDFVKLHSA